jgi:hypothetical protein
MGLAASAVPAAFAGKKKTNIHYHHVRTPRVHDGIADSLQNTRSRARLPLSTVSDPLFVTTIVSES